MQKIRSVNGRRFCAHRPSQDFTPPPPAFPAIIILSNLLSSLTRSRFLNSYKPGIDGSRTWIGRAAPNFCILKRYSSTNLWERVGRWCAKRRRRRRRRCSRCIFGSHTDRSVRRGKRAHGPVKPCGSRLSPAEEVNLLLPRLYFNTPGVLKIYCLHLLEYSGGFLLLQMLLVVEN